MSLSLAKFDSFLSSTLAPATIVFEFNKEILLNLFPSFIITPSNTSSLNNTFEPAPKLKILPLLL